MDKKTIKEIRKILRIYLSDLRNDLSPEIIQETSAKWIGHTRVNYVKKETGTTPFTAEELLVLLVRLQDYYRINPHADINIQPLLDKIRQIIK